jgi:hypothetical protein
MRASKWVIFFPLLAFASWTSGMATAAPQCKVVMERTFEAGHEVVRLARQANLTDSANVAIFKAPLAVNTDGAPTSYHPEDFRGTQLAINRIDNGIGIRKANGENVPLPKKIEVFDKWRKSGNWKVPSGYKIRWNNVIAAEPNGDPCIFAQGENKGYFGSLTSLQNGLSGQNAGECQVKNQLDQRFVPAIVLRGDSNPLKSYGAKTGDLVLAYNPENKVIVPAIIGDAGDGDRIGEGSVALNMALLKRPEQPKTYSEALSLDTGAKDMIIAVIPGSRSYKRERPYSAENIKDRVQKWSAEQHYGSLDELSAAIAECAKGL